MDNNFFTELEAILTSESFLELISKIRHPEERKRLLVRSLNYLISTRDFKEYEYYIKHFHKSFPSDYLIQKGMTKEESDAFMFENYIKNGYLFHVTPSYNVNQITKNGLMTLNDKANTDLYQKSMRINNIYSDIVRRNPRYFSLTTLITIPGEAELSEERFNSIYLSSNLEYILNTYGQTGEFADYFVRNIFWGFNVNKNYCGMSKDDIQKELISILESGNFRIKDEEIDEILSFFNLIYHEKAKEENLGQSIVFVPTEKIKSNPKFDFLYRENRLGLSVPTLIDFDKDEVVHTGSIDRDDLIVLAPDENKCLRLIKK